MSITCRNCGNTNHAPGARNCAVCGASLPAPVAVRPPVPVGGRAANPASAAPMLVSAAGRRYRLSSGGDTLIGSQGCAITLADPGVSPRHARVFPSGGGFAVEDMGGGISINGRQVRGPHPLQPGDTIAVGQANLVYQGPATSPAAVPPQPSPSPAPVVQQHKPAIVPPPRAPVQHPQPQHPAVRLKTWREQPTAEGEIKLIDGPHMMDKGNVVGKLAAAAALGLATGGRLAFLPFMGRQQIPVWFLRIEDLHTGQSISVLMGGQPTSLPQLGDIIAVWGPVKEGNVMMEKGYSYATNSEIRLKR